MHVFVVSLNDAASSSRSEPVKCLLKAPGGSLVETAECDLDLRALCQFLRHYAHGHFRRLVLRVAIDALADGREGDRAEAMLARDLQRAAMAGGERLFLAMIAAFPARADRMDHMARRQAIAGRDLGIARAAPAKSAAFLKQLRPGRAMDR